MTEIPDYPNLYCSLNTSLSRKQIAGLYAAIGWEVRKCTWTDFEVFGPWCELVIEGESPILMHGSVADILVHAAEIVAPLRAGCISFTVECYGPQPARDLLLELRS